MTTTPRPSSPMPSSSGVGRYTGLVLGLVVFVCLVMIGFAGYLKYELDRAETVLAAPEAAIDIDQETFDKLRRSLGYSGFIGLAQNFAASHNAASLPDMKAQIKTATDIVTRLPDKTSTETRRDLQAIVGTFDAALQKADKSSTDPAVSFTTADMAPLYAALPVLDSRITAAAAVNRLAAQAHAQFWAMLLTLVCWSSLIIASAMAVGAYLSLRDRNSAPMRALTQSVKNLAHGDLRTSLWGMERSDAVGELARAVDLARFHFSQLPDMSLLSDQGPVRIRFEGNTKSMFEGMMQVIARDSEQVRTQATSLAEAVNSQQKAIAHMTSQVETVLHNILQRGHDGNQHVKNVMEAMVSTANSLNHAQEHAADQLNRIIPYLQERAQGLTEITQITGKQVSHVLQSLILSERGLKSSARESETAIKKLSTTADSLGERLFGAINLLQASGKVLAETTETTQSRLKEAIEKLNQPMPTAAPVGAADTGVASETAERLEGLIGSLELAHRKLEDILTEQTQAAKAQIDLLTTHSTGLLSQTTTTTQTLSTAADHLRNEQAKFDQTISQISGKLDTIGEHLEQQASEAFAKTGTEAAPASDQTRVQLADIAAQIGQMAEKLSTLNQPVFTPDASGDATLANNLLLEIRTGFETTVRSLGQMREQLTNMAINVQTQMPIAPIADNHWQDIAAQIEATRTGLTQLVMQQIERIETRLASPTSHAEPTAPAISRDAQEQMEQQTQILTELVTTLGILDAHMQEIRSQVTGLKAG